MHASWVQLSVLHTHFNFSKRQRVKDSQFEYGKSIFQNKNQIQQSPLNAAAEIGILHISKLRSSVFNSSALSTLYESSYYDSSYCWVYVAPIQKVIQYVLNLKYLFKSTFAKHGLSASKFKWILCYANTAIKSEVFLTKNIDQICLLQKWCEKHHSSILRRVSSKSVVYLWRRIWGFGFI